MVLVVCGVYWHQIVQVYSRYTDQILDEFHPFLLALSLCDDIILANGRVTYDPTSSPRLEGTTATHICNGNSVRSGGSQRICQSDRMWSGDIITCNGKNKQTCIIIFLVFSNRHYLSTSCWLSLWPNILLSDHSPIWIWNTSNVHCHLPSWTGEEWRKWCEDLLGRWTNCCGGVDRNCSHLCRFARKISCCGCRHYSQWQSIMFWYTY